MKMMRTKLGKKLVGSLITCSLVFGLLPGISVTARSALPDGTVDVDATPTATVKAGTPATYGGIVLSALTGSEDIKVANGDHRFQVGDGGYTEADYTFAIDADGDYTGGFITKIEINATSIDGCTVQAGSGWSTLDGIVTWEGTAASSVSMTLESTSGRSHRLHFSSITVYVEVPVTSVTITGVPVDFVTVGSTVQLGVVVEPSNTTYKVVTWETDSECATVDENGLVTVTGEDIIVITATLGDKEGTAGIVSYIPVGEFSITPTELEMTTDDDPAVVSAIIDPETDWAIIEWSISDESVATIEKSEDMMSVTVTPVGAGEAEITAVLYTVEFPEGLDVTCFVTVTEPGPEPGPAPEPEEPVLTPEQIQRMAVEHFVERLYVEALGRQFDKTGRDHWVDMLLAGGSASSVARGFFGSREFLGRDLTNEEFVTILYKVYFDSVPQTGRYTNYVDALYNDTMTRSEVIDDFAATYEWAALCGRYSVNV